MTNQYMKAVRLPNCFFVMFFLYFMVLPVASELRAICPALDSSPTNRPHFKQNNKVYYHFDSSVSTTGSERDQIRTAFSTWHNANQSNCSKVQFIEGTAPTGFGYATLTIKDQIIISNFLTQGGAASDFDSTGGVNGFNEVTSATISFNSDLRVDPSDLRRLYDPSLTVPYSTIFTKQALHEIGHGMGLNHISGNPCDNTLKGNSVMFPACDFDDAGGAISLSVTDCDKASINAIYICPTPTPTPVQPTCGAQAAPVEGDGSCPFGYYPDGTAGVWCCPNYLYGGCNQPTRPDGTCSTGFVNVGGTCTRSSSFQSQCLRFGDYDSESCGCTGGCEGGGCSPIVVDVIGDGFLMTNAANGVRFDLDNDGFPELRSWVNQTSDDAWLVLDRNHNGLIDKGREMFGNATPQLPPESGEEMNGFRALALYDGFAYGGNGDGKIDSQDAIFSLLKLWQDRNHNGVSESCELFSLPELGLASIDLTYRRSGRTDQYGNQFRFRSKVTGTDGTQLGRWAWDVYLLQGN